MSDFGAFTSEVRAKPEDLEAFADGGERYVFAMTSIAEQVSTTRRAVVAALGSGPDLPDAMAARAGHAGAGDSFAELISEATYINGFVRQISEALTTETTTNGIATSPTDAVTTALRLAGYSTSDEDVSLTEDMIRLAEIRIRAELGEIVTDGVAEGELYGELQAVGGRVQAYVDGLSPEERRVVGQVMVDYGIDLQAQVDPDSFSDIDYRQQAATLLVTHGLDITPDHQLARYVDRLHTRTAPTIDGTDRPALELLVDALDLNEQTVLLSGHGVSVSWNTWQTNVQPYQRQRHLDRLIQSTIDPNRDGVIGQGGQALVDYTLDRYPRIVEASDSKTLYQNGYGHRPAPEFDLRTTLATALAAPNYGLTDDVYRAAVRLDEVDAGLVAAGSQTEFDRLWLERTALLSLLAESDVDTETLINQAIGRGVSAADAARLAANAATPALTNLRVRRVRLVYETDAFGQPVAPDRLENLHATDSVAQSLFVELSVLQTIQETRFVGEPSTLPLTPEQIQLVAEFGQMSRWFYHRLAGAYPGGIEPALEFVATADRATIDAMFFDMPDGLLDLARQLTAPENSKIWELLPGAADNDTFLGPNGAYRSEGGRSHTITSDFQALVIQMTLLARLGPLAEDLGATIDGASIHEDDIEAWLKEHRNDVNVPPGLVDLIETGRSFGLGEDTFGWEEVGEIIGWVGLAAAVTATIVYSGGTAAPLWVQAGLIGLAGLEAYAFIKADDPFNAAIAGVGGIADLVTAARLIRRSQATLDVGVRGPAAAMGLARNRQELIDLARRSTNAALRRLADEAGHLDLGELLDRYRSIIGRNPAAVAKELVDQGLPPAKALEVLNELDDAQLGRMQPDSLDSFYKAVELEEAGRITGLDAWVNTMLKSGRDDIHRTHHELIAARDAAEQYPGHTVRIDVDADGAAKSFDLEVIDSNGTVVRSIEVGYGENPVLKIEDFSGGGALVHASKKVSQLSTTSSPIQGVREARVVVRIEEVTISEPARFRIERNLETGDITQTVAVGTEHEHVSEAYNLFDEYAKYLNYPEYSHLATGLDFITITNREGLSLAAYKFEAGVWRRVE
ncbi:MAG: hypothetical protein ACRBK7_12215 [Acidimicrobiales bacterium]